MKTAVPGTRVGGSAARSASSSFSGTVFSIMRLDRISRPRFQVLIAKYSTIAIATAARAARINPARRRWAGSRAGSSGAASSGPGTSSGLMAGGGFSVSF